MLRTNVTCIDNDKTVGADILSQTGRVLKVAVDGFDESLTLTKNTVADKFFIGRKYGMEFTSTGEEI